MWPILCLYFWGPKAMRGNNFKQKKFVPLIFTQFWIRSHLNKLDRLTPQDAYCIMISRNDNNIMILCCVAVCHLLRSGVAALFGPQSGTTSSHVQSICDAMEIPHIETRWDYRLRRDEYSVNLYPHPSALSKVSPSLQIDSFFCFLNSKR